MVHQWGGRASGRVRSERLKSPEKLAGFARYPTDIVLNLSECALERSGSHGCECRSKGDKSSELDHCTRGSCSEILGKYEVRQQRIPRIYISMADEIKMCLITWKLQFNLKSRNT